MSALSKQLLAIALEGLDLIGDIAAEHGGSKGQTADMALKAVEAIVKSIKTGQAKDATPDEVIAQINKTSADLDTQIAAHRQTEQDLLDKKFGKPATTP